MFTLMDFVIFGLVGVVLACISTFVTLEADDPELRKKVRWAVFICDVLIIAAVMIGCGAYNTRTESGKRHLKTWQSETTGGIDRTVTVYDISGEEIAKYSGRFDVEESAQEGVVKIKFDSNGKRHIIYAQTGTVLIDEK